MGLILAGCTPSKRALNCRARAANSEEPPTDLAPFTLRSVDADRSEMGEGHLLLNQFGDTTSYGVAIDGCGIHEWWVSTAGPRRKINRIRAAQDGTSVLYTEYDRERIEDNAVLVRVDPQRGTLSETRVASQHHDFVEYDGELAWLSWEYHKNEWFPNLAENVASDAIRMAPEGETGDGEIGFSLVQDSGIAPFWSCSHMQPDQFVPGHAEWTHSNSLVYEPITDAFYVLVRYWDAVLKIDRDGTVAWMMGGPDNGFQPLGDTRLPMHGHMSEVWPGGMLVFDNGNHTAPPSSRVVEYALDEDARTVEEVWSFALPTEPFITYLGDARRLPGGNVLIAWSSLGRLTEITPDGDIVWDAATDDTIGRIEWLNEWPPAP